MNYPRFILASLLLSTLLLNCECRHLCTSIPPQVSLISYDSTTLNAVILRQYQDNGQFNNLQHTTVFTSLIFTSTHMPGPDTLQFNAGRTIPLEYSQDYVIEIPAAGKMWYLRVMGTVPTRMNVECVNGVKYTLNDTMYATHPISSSSNTPPTIILSN